MKKKGNNLNYDKEHIPANTRAGLIAMNSGKPLAELDGDTKPILDRLEAGESAVQIANSLGINRVSLYAWLIRHCPEQWQAVATARQLSRLDECEDILDSPIATQIINKGGTEIEIVDPKLDGAIVTRARDKARMAQWHLERANKKLFGDNKGGNDNRVMVVVDREGAVQVAVDK
jgi:transposase-like protein